MKTLILSLLVAIASTQAHAESPELWGRKTVRCASGKVNPDGEFASGPGLFSAPGIRYFASSHGGQLLVSAHDAVMIVPVSGDTASDCQNNGEPTILILTIQK